MGFSNLLKLESIDVYPIRSAGGNSPNMALGLMPTRPALLVSITDTEGCAGWGEIWANFPPRANLHKAHLIEDVVASRLIGFAFTDPREVDEYLRDDLATYFLHVGQQKVFEHILAGLDTALWDLALRNAGRSFAAHMNLTEPSSATYASSINPPDLGNFMSHHSGMGQTHFKLKLGFGDDTDCNFVERASSLCPPNGRIMIDSNQTWQPKQAQSMLRSLEAFDLLFAEEPLRADLDYFEWERLAAATSVPLAGGENVYGVDAFLAMADAGLRYLQPDVAKWGGVSGALELSKRLPSGVQLWPHFMGTAVGQMAALSISAAVGPTSVCEMDVNANPLRTELCGNHLEISDGRIGLVEEPGLLVPPCAAVLKRYRDKLN